MMRAAIVEKNIPPGKWVVGYGYDKSRMSRLSKPFPEGVLFIATND